jgi:hypothetical protein
VVIYQKIKMKKVSQNIQKLSENTVRDITFGIDGMKKYFKILPKNIASSIDFAVIETANKDLDNAIVELKKIRNLNDTKTLQCKSREKISELESNRKLQLQETEERFDKLIANKKVELQELKQEKVAALIEIRSSAKQNKEKLRAERAKSIASGKDKVENGKL